MTWPGSERRKTTYRNGDECTFSDKKEIISILAEIRTDIAVMQEQLKTMRIIIYGLVGLILSGVILAILQGVLRIHA